METTFRLHDNELTPQLIETIKTLFKDKEFEITIRDTVNSPYDWINPYRPATDYEFETMIAECEAEYSNGRILSADQALNETLKPEQKTGFN
jgi:hypothetical protein